MSSPSASAAPTGATPPVRPSIDPKATESVLHLLARAVRQFHTYPATSAMCVDAVAACHQAIASLEGGDHVALRVAAHEFFHDNTAIGAGTIIEQELVHRLHRARVAAVDISRAVSKRDLSRFCSDLMRVPESGEAEVPLADMLAEHGVETIVARMAERPEILDLGAPAAPLRDLVDHERQRHEPMPAGEAAHLYPPGKGWARLDPTASLDSVSLVDLAVLVNDPSHLAEMLLRLAEDEPAGPEAKETALERKFSDVATLISALDPRLARHMFGKLARAVLDLEPERRQALLRRTILPGLLEGRVDGTVLQDFPDPDLAESLCLLLDLETAGPSVLSAALDRMDLTPERRQAMVPLLEERVEARGRRQAGRTEQAAQAADTAVDRYARERFKIDPNADTSFAEFTAFDLSMDEQATALLERVRDDASSDDQRRAQLRCLSSLIRLEPNPGDVEAFLAQWTTLVADMERESCWQDVAAAIGEQRREADTLRQQRPDVADAIGTALAAYCTRERMAALLDLHAAGEQSRPLAASLLDAYGSAAVPACIALLEEATDSGRERLIVQLLSERATLVAPELAARLGDVGVGAVRSIVRVLGAAGAGYETAIAAQFKRRDEQTIREALRSLAQIGSAQAASYIASQLEHPATAVRQAAEQALFHLPPPRVQAPLRELLAKRDFVVRNPELATRMLDRAAQTGVGGLDAALAALAPLRFRFWAPAVAGVGRKARKLMQR